MIINNKLKKIPFLIFAIIAFSLAAAYLSISGVSEGPAIIEGKEKPEKKYDFSDTSNWNLTISAWEKLAEKDYDGVFAYTSKCLELYENEAKDMAKEMRGFARFGHEDDCAIANDVATCRYIMGEAYMRLKDYDKAICEFQLVINEYPYSQCWDPKGWFWKVAEVSSKNIEKIKNIREEK